MVKRYANKKVDRIFSDENKLALWQATELAVIEAGVKLGKVPAEAFERIKRIWTSTPIDIEWWLKRDEEIKHDLNAFIDERIRHLPPELQQYVHANGITSYDTEEPAFARMLLDCAALTDESYRALLAAVMDLAIRHRHTIMMARTHGQEAELQSFGARCLTWFSDLGAAWGDIGALLDKLRFSKISGAIGKYGSIDPELEREALGILGFEPYYGATQIMPRVIYARLGQALCNLVMVIQKIALDIRLNARSGRPLMREPFGKRQKGSSAMPHKKNTILTEQLEGMARMAKGFAGMITDSIPTWEERAIEQSCVERVAWPDLFHVTLRSLDVLTKVLKGLQVYPDNMLREVHESRGVYASAEAKEFLKAHGFAHEDAYRLVQLACFLAFELPEGWRQERERACGSYDEARKALETVESLEPDKVLSIRRIISRAILKTSDELDIGSEEVSAFNGRLRSLFGDTEIMEEWNRLFDPAFHLRNEAVLYKRILGID
jgi:adenylosuccinate lyase